MACLQGEPLRVNRKVPELATVAAKQDLTAAVDAAENAAVTAVETAMIAAADGVQVVPAIAPARALDRAAEILFLLSVALPSAADPLIRAAAPIVPLSVSSCPVKNHANVSMIALVAVEIAHAVVAAAIAVAAGAVVDVMAIRDRVAAAVVAKVVVAEDTATVMIAVADVVRAEMIAAVAADTNAPRAVIKRRTFLPTVILS